MKAFLYILITFIFIGTAYSQETVTTVSATEIITKGKVIEGATYKLGDPIKQEHWGSHYSMLVLYKKEIYICTVYPIEVWCKRPQDVGVITD